MLFQFKKKEPDYNIIAGELLEKYGNNILRFAFSYLHNIEDAEDIVQEVLIKFIESKPELRTEKETKAWILAVTSNLSKNKLEYNKRRLHEDIDTIELQEEKDFYTEDVLEAVNSLKERQRELIHLFYYEGYTSKEISCILNLNESTVRSDLKRAREKLKSILREAYDFE